MAIESFDALYARAVKRVGSEDELEASLPEARSKRSLVRVTDDRWLAEMTRSVFRAGFVWKIIDAKWKGFEEVFQGFDTMACAMLSDEELEAIQLDARIVRNGAKIRTVRDNAVFIRQVRDEAGTSFAKFVADWPEHDIVGLWTVLKKQGARLGGNSGPMTLRWMGKDTFILTGDVSRALVRAGVVDKPPSGVRALARVQQAFNDWREESGRTLCEMSRILAHSAG